MHPRGCRRRVSQILNPENKPTVRKGKAMKYDYLIVGAGLFGATIAQIMHARGKNVLVIERRNHIAGNVYTENIEGIHVHKYGAHIFHTNN